MTITKTRADAINTRTAANPNTQTPTKPREIHYCHDYNMAHYYTAGRDAYAHLYQQERNQCALGANYSRSYDRGYNQATRNTARI